MNSGSVIQKNDGQVVFSETQLPEIYHEDKITLMVKDPKWVFSYWGTSVPREDLFIKLYENGRGMKPISVGHKKTKNWYHGDLNPNTNYKIELGFKDINGTFCKLTESGNVRTPPNSISNVIDNKVGIIKNKAFTEIIKKQLEIGSHPSSLHELIKRRLYELEITNIPSSSGIYKK